MRTCTWLRTALWLLVAAMNSICTPAGWAQAISGQGEPVTESKEKTKPEFKLPAIRQHFRSHLKSTFGIEASLKSAFAAGISQFSNAPPEWGQGAKGYGRRVAGNFGRSAIRNGIEFGLESVLRQDASYRRCACSGFLRRVTHALSSEFIARGHDGSRTLTFIKIAGHYGGGMISMAWYPDRYSATGDGFRLGTISLGMGMGVNVIREFWPQLRTLFRPPSKNGRR